MKFSRTVALGLLIVVIAGGALAIGLWASSSSAQGCSKHEVTIRNSQVLPKQTYGKLCDSLTITNQDNETRLLAFGYHDKHVAYDGVKERLLKQGESVTIVFNKAGDFHFHDHEHDEVEGYFTVTE